MAINNSIPNAATCEVASKIHGISSAVGNEKWFHYVGTDFTNYGITPEVWGDVVFGKVYAPVGTNTNTPSPILVPEIINSKTITNSSCYAQTLIVNCYYTAKVSANFTSEFISGFVTPKFDNGSGTLAAHTENYGNIELSVFHPTNIPQVNNVSVRHREWYTFTTYIPISSGQTITLRTSLVGQFEFWNATNSTSVSFDDWGTWFRVVGIKN